MVQNELEIENEVSFRLNMISTRDELYPPTPAPLIRACTIILLHITPDVMYSKLL